MFSVNEKVVCIKTYKILEVDIEVGNVLPVKGEMYTIRDIFVQQGDVFFTFHELVNPIVEYEDGVNEIQFWHGNFRKLDHSFAENLLAKMIEQNREEELCITR